MSVAFFKSDQTRPEITPPWGPLRGLVAALGIFALSQLVVVFALVASGVDVKQLSSAQTLLVALASSLLLAAMIWGFALRRSPQPKAALGLVKPKGRVWLKIIAAMGIFIIATALITALVDVLWAGFDADEEQELGLGQPDGLLNFVGMALLLVVVTPLTEEMLFRGLLFGGFKSKWGFVPAALLSGLLFGAVHWQPNVVIATVVLGWLLAWLYHSTGSLWASIALHSLKNAVAFVLLYGVSGV